MPSAVKAEDLANGALQPEHTIKQEAVAVKQEPLTATEEDSKPVLAKAEPNVPMKAELKAEQLGEVKEEAGVNTGEPGAQPSNEQLAARLQALLHGADMSRAELCCLSHLQQCRMDSPTASSVQPAWEIMMQSLAPAALACPVHALHSCSCHLKRSHQC